MISRMAAGEFDEADASRRIASVGHNTIGGSPDYTELLRRTPAKAGSASDA